MNVEFFANCLTNIGISLVTGVPDSTLKEFCEYINGNARDLDRLHHICCANEGSSIGLAVGTFLSSGKPACVYMQNSGLGNTVNPVTSITNGDVYGIPVLFLIGWRGEPGVHDEPQHKFMGRITIKMLELLEIEYVILDESSTCDEVTAAFSKAKRVLSANMQFAIILKKGAFEKYAVQKAAENVELLREKAIETILRRINKHDYVVSTTGKISREAYELSDKIYGDHSQVFLTVGGMGHASMIALGIAVNCPNKRVYCLDGDGAVLMHMGNLPVIAANSPNNMIHICLNNRAHESVGGMPTGAEKCSYAMVAKSVGYKAVYTVYTEDELSRIISDIQNIDGPVFIEVIVSKKSRSDLLRPKESASENKIAFMAYHGGMSK